MSNNHPNDNIYSILGKLDALKPTPEEKRMSLVKEIQATVDAQGSITEGVGSVEAKLRKQLGESVAEVAPPGAKAERMVKGIKKSLTKDSHLSDKDKAIAYATTWKAHNKGQVEEACRACNEGTCTDHMNEESEQFHSDRVALLGKINKVIQSIQTPEQYKNALGFVKRAFVKLNSGQSDEPTFSSKAIQRIHQDSRALEKDLAAKAKELGIEPQGFLEAYNPNSVDAQHSSETKAHQRAELKKKADAGDKDAQAKLARYKEKDANKSQAFNDRMEYNEAEITRTASKTVHRKTDFPGYPVDEPEDIEDTNKGKRGRPRKHAAKAPTGLGRGRPAKPKAPTYSKQADPFGRISGSVPKGAKGTVHSMDEAMTQLKLNLDSMQLNEGRYLEDGAGETLNHILNRFRAEVRSFEQGGDLDNDLYDALYDYYVESGEMPYGVQKARTGDPMNWVAEHLDAELGDIAYGKNPANAEGAGLEMEAGIPGNIPAEQIPGKEDLLKGKGRSYYEEDALEEELNELARLAGLGTNEGNAFTGKLANTPKGGEFELDGKTFKDTSALGEADLEEESPTADKDYDQDGEIESEKDEVIGSRRKAAGLDESTSFDSESSDFNISTNMSSDGEKNVTVTATGDHAATLLQMLRIAGLGNGQAAQELEATPHIRSVGITPGGVEQPEADVMVLDVPEVMDEEGIEVDHPAQEPANAPHEKYGTIKNITTQGDDMNREKTQDPATANKAANPLTNAQRVLKSVAQLESKLAEEYESIKKVSK